MAGRSTPGGLPEVSLRPGWLTLARSSTPQATDTGTP